MYSKPPFGLQSLSVVHLPFASALPLFASPKQANAMVARPTLNFLSAARRVTAWAMLLVSSSNWWFMFFLSVLVLLFVSLGRENDRVTCGSAFAHLLIRRKKMAVTLS